jgi:hypothetical protein
VSNWAIGDVLWPGAGGSPGGGIGLGAVPKPVFTGDLIFGPATSVDIGIASTPGYSLAIVFVQSDVQPNTPPGWVHTLTCGPAPFSSVYVYETAATAATNLTITFPTTAAGGVSAVFTEDTAVIARGSTALAGGDSYSFDVDRSDPSLPSTILLGSLKGGVGTEFFHPWWEFVGNVFQPFLGPSEIASWWMYEGEPPPTVVNEQDFGPVTGHEFWGWFYLELASP